MSDVVAVSELVDVLVIYDVFLAVTDLGVVIFGRCLCIRVPAAASSQDLEVAAATSQGRHVSRRLSLISILDWQ